LSVTGAETGRFIFSWKSLTKEGVDDWDKSASFGGAATRPVCGVTTAGEWKTISPGDFEAELIERSATG